MTLEKKLKFGGKWVQVHKVSLKVPHELFASGVLPFHLELKTGDSGITGGLDNFSIVAHYPCDSSGSGLTPPVSLDQQCVGFTGSWSGDPHMRTFNGLK